MGFDKTKDVRDFVGTLLTDSALLVAVLFVEYLLEQYVFPKFPVSSEIAKLSFFLFRIIFALTLVSLWALVAYKNFRIRWMRSQAAIKREAEVIQDRANPNEWRVEDINFEDEGSVNVAIFSGPDAEARARVYANWKNMSVAVKLKTAI